MAPGNLDGILSRYRRLTEPSWGADLVIWPETAVPTSYGEVQDTFGRSLAARAAKAGTSVITGVPTRAQGRAYNSAVTVGRQAVYHKRHLVPFGEFVPLRSLLGGMLDVFGAPMSDFSAGRRVTLLPAAGYRAGIAICYEIAFGREVAAVLPGANLVINLSNDAWFGDSIGPRQHLQIARMRAIELERYVLRATNTGVTAVIDPSGRVVARAPQFEQARLVARVSPRDGLTPYARWTNWPVLGLIGVVLVILVAIRLARRRRSGHGADRRC
ncbi:MAG: apolipoprotein N-acyltransferase [Halofilum sp. (in: g-proteobacteria)]|nr:apolipoprotein N-acyltransferase [Halofilum sp. (in: g-proteobacteria)]